MTTADPPLSSDAPPPPVEPTAVHSSEQPEQVSPSYVALVTGTAPDYQMARVYAAEEEWSYKLLDELDPDPDVDLAPNEVAPFIANVLDRIGWRGPLPELVFDLDDRSEYAGFHSAPWGGHGAIHLPADGTRTLVVTHEMSHYYDNRDAHGPRFCANHVSIVDAAFGEKAAQLLLAAYRHHLVDFNPYFLPEWGWPPE